MEAEIQQDAVTIEQGEGRKIGRFDPDPRELIELTPELAGYIIREISKGRSLLSICSEDGVCHETTFLKRCHTDPELGEAYQAAKKLRAHKRVEQVEQITDELDPKQTSKQEAYVADVKAKNLVRLAEIGDPASFSPRIQHAHSGNLVNITLDLSSPQPNARQVIDTTAEQVTETPKLASPLSGEEKEKGGGGGGS